MKKIPEPIFCCLGDQELERQEFEEWFDKYVKPVNEMLENAVEVYRINQSDWEESMIHTGFYTHKALLINIEPIKKETAEDVLRDFVSEFNRIKFGDELFNPQKYLDRAKKVLEASSGALVESETRWQED